MATEVGVVKALMGEVTATAADGSERILRVGDIVYANELISTGPGGAVELEFADGSVMDLGRSSQAMLDSDVIDPSAATNAIAQGDDVPEDVAALQQAILEGEDPTEGGEATAAGAGVQNGNEGHEAVFVNYLNPEITPEAGFDTIGVTNTIDEYIDEQLIDGVPTAGLITVELDEDDLGFFDSEAAFIAFNNLISGIQSAFQSDTGYQLSAAPHFGVGDSNPGDDLPSPNPTFFSGALNADYGLNGPGSISFNPVVSQPTGLTSGGQPIQIWVSPDGLTLIGYIAGEGDSLASARVAQEFDGAEIIFSAQIDPTTLNFSAGIYGPVDHPDTAETGSFEENLLINMAFTITDADGDAAQGIVRLNVDDDSPVIGEQSEQPFPGEGIQEGDYPYGSESALVDEDDTENGVGNTDSLGDDDGAPVVTLPINFGADGPAAENPVEIHADGIVDQFGNPLTSNGVEIQFSWNAVTNTLEGTADGQAVINIHVNVVDYGFGTDSQVYVELLDNLDHPQGADGEVLGIEDNLNINIEYTASDADGDQVDGNFDLSIDDDMPVIGTPEAVSVDEEGINGNAGDSYDADATVNGVLFMPELENGDLNSALDTDAKQAIKSFVEAGGQLVINGSSGSNDESLLNDIFGFSITNGANTSSNVPTFSQTGAVTGTDFESGPAQLNNPNGTYTWDISSLPAEATVMYSDGDDAAVVTIPVGDGQITFLAYDWYNAAPTGSQDGGWTDILDIAVSANGSPAEISVFDNGSYVDTNSGGVSAESDNVQDTLQSQGHNVSTFTGITLADILAALPEFSTGDLAGEETVASGSLAINWGADDNNDAESDYDRSVVFSEQSAPEGLTADGQPVTYTISEDGTMLTAFTGEQGTDSYTEVFTVSLSDVDNGSYTFTLLGNLDHPEANTEDDINLNFSFTATDSDGDSATGSFAVTIDDDAPVASGESVEFTVDEDDINTGLSEGNQVNDGNDDGSFTGSSTNPFDNGPANVSGSVAALVSFGADGAGGFTLGNNFDALMAQNLTSQGDTLSYSVDGNVLTAEADGREVFTLTLNDNGDFTFALNDQLDHADADGQNNLPVDLSSVIVATDADGDAITLDSGFTINITDDVPEQAGLLPEVGIVEDEALPGGNQEINDFTQTIDLGFLGTITIAVDGWPDTAIATGSLADQVSVGADDPATFSLSGDFTQLISQNLTSGGEQLSYTVDGDTLYAVADQTAIFTLKLEANGDYTFTLMGPLDHADGILEENVLPIDFSALVDVTDADGDMITLDQDFYINVVDDSPEVGNNAVVRLDDDALTGGNPGGPGDNVDAANVTGTLDHSFGADGGSIGWKTSGAPNGFSYETNGDDLLIKQDGETVLTLTLDPQTGDYTVTQNAPIEHRDNGNNNENNQIFNVGYLVTDGDGDTADGALRINVDDDTPTVEPYEVNTMRIISDDDSVAGLNGNPGGVGDSNQYNLNGTLQFSAGADGGTVAWNVANSSSDGGAADVTFSVDGDGSLILTQMQNGVAVQVAKATLDENTGEYSYTQTANLLHTPGGDENNADFTLGFTVTDGDGDEADGHLVLRIDDDTPTVADFNVNTMRIISDDDTVAGLNGNPGEGSNTTDGAGTDSKEYNQSKTLQFSVGADGGTVAWNVDNSSVDDGTQGVSFSVNDDGSLILTQMQGGVPVEIAVVTLDENTGDYTYTQTGNLLHTAGDSENNALFTLGFTVTDGDGDTADGHLTLSIDDDTPTVAEYNVNTMRIISDDDTVAGLNGNPGEGTNTTDGAGTDSKEYNQSKTLQFSAGADGGTVAWNVDNSSVDDDTAGVSFSVNDDGSLVLTQMQDGVPVEIAVITLDPNTGDYDYTQTGNLLHTAGDNENNAAFTLGFTVTDGDGDTADGHLTLLIDDDSPVVTSQQINLLTESFENFAPDLSGNNWTVVGEGGGTIIGNNGIEWTVNGAGIEIQSGNVGGASASDGDVHAELDAHDSNGDGGSTLTQLSTDVNLPTSEATLSFDFQPRPSDVDGSDMAVSLGGQVVSINVNGAGVIDFGSLPAGVSATQTSSAGGWTTITLTFTGLDTGSAQTLTFEGVGSADTLGAYLDNISLNAVASLTVDESVLADGNGEAGASASASYDFSAFFSGEFGADGAGDESFSLNLNGSDVASGLYAVDNADTSTVDGDGFGQGNEIVLNQSGNVITGSADGVDYFTISVNPDTGEVTLTQLENIWHADTTNPDDAQGMMLDAETLSLIKTLTDADGDSAEASLDLSGVNFNFEDDAPVITAEQPTQPFLITVTNEGGDAGYNNTYGFYIKGDDGQPESGQIIWSNVKEHVSDDISVDATDPSDIGFFIIPDGADLNALTDGAEVTFQQDGDGNWQVVLDGTPLSGQGTNVLFDNADLNPGNADAMQDNAAAGNQNWEDIIGGDNDFNDVNINVSISQLGALTVDETDIGNGDPSSATASLDLSGSFDINYGADGEGSVSYSLGVADDAESGLVDTISGKTVELRVNGDGEVEGFITTDDNVDLVVFNAGVDENGELTLTQYRAVEHDDPTDADEANSPAAVNPDAIILSAVVTDADGDSASSSIDAGVLFAFEDDGPVAVNDVDSITDGSADGNVVTADSTDGTAGVDSFGADGAGSVTSVTFGDTTVNVPAEGSANIDGDFGTLTLNSDGSYVYTVNPDNLPHNTQTVEGWADNGSNMTAFSLGQSFLTADGKFSDTGTGTVTTGGNAPGFGVAGTSGANGSVPAQVNYSGSESEALAFKFDGTVTSATVQFSNLFQNENGGEAMRWHAFDADGNRIDSGIVSDNQNASDPYANSTDATFDNNNVGTFTLSDIGAFTTLVFEGLPYSDDGSAGADDSDFFVNVTSYEVVDTEANAYQDQFTYTIVDGDGDSASATITLNGQSEPQEGQLEAIAPVAADNTYQVDGETTGNIITDDDDNGGAATGRDYDNDTPVSNLMIHSIIVGEQTTLITADNTEIELDNGTLVINLDGSYTYTPNEDAEAGDEFEYTLVDPDGEISEPATVTLEFTDNPVEITGLTPQAEGGDAVVDEDDLSAARGTGESAGSDGSDSTTAQGSFFISAPDGVASLTIGGQSIITNGTFAAVSFTTLDGNTLNVTDYDSVTGEVSYEYTLNDNTLDHGLADNGQNSVYENLEVKLVDNDNDEAVDNLSVQIVDDIPVVAPLTFGTITDGSTQSDVSLESLFGADGAGDIAFDASLDGQSVLQGGEQVFFNGEALTWSLAGDVLTAKTPSDTSAITVTLNDADGNYDISVADGTFYLAGDEQSFAIGDLSGSNAVAWVGQSTGIDTLIISEGTSTNTSNAGGTGYVGAGSQWIDAGTPDSTTFYFFDSIDSPTGALNSQADIDTALTDSSVAGVSSLSVSVNTQGGATTSLNLSFTAVDGTEGTATVSIGSNNPSTPFLLEVDSTDITWDGGASGLAIASITFPATSDVDYRVGGDLVYNEITPSDVNLDLPVTITDADGDTDDGSITGTITSDGQAPAVDVDHTPEISDLTPAANGGDVTVDEDDLSDGSDTSKESTTQEGTFTISSGDAIDDLTIDGHSVIADGTFSATSFTTGLGNTLSVTGYNAGTGEITYTYELSDNTLTHGPSDDGQNGVFENFDVVLSDMDGDQADDILSVQIVDDVPSAENDNAQSEEGSSTTLGSDLVLMIDTSASVSSSDLSSLKTSLQNLFNSGSVHSVFITSFAEGGTFHDSGVNGGWYTDLGAAMTAINGLSSSGSGTYGTDYDAALEAVTENFTAPPAGGDQLVSMFISDGEPNETNGTGSYGIIGGEETAWIDFLEANGFDNSFAVGYNGLDSTDIAYLEPIAWTEGESSSTHTGSDDDNVIILDNVEDLADTLTSTVTATPTPITGNVLTNDDAGADGFGTPALVDVTYDGNTVTFTDTTTSATFNTVAGTVVINSDGSYEFTGLSDTDSDVGAVIGYTIVDGDGDQSSANLLVSTQDSVPVAENDSDNVEEATWSIDGTNSASVVLEGWSDAQGTQSVGGLDWVDPYNDYGYGYGDRSDNSNTFVIDADAQHPASVDVSVSVYNAYGYSNYSDEVEVELFMQGQSSPVDTITLNLNYGFDNYQGFNVSFDNITQGGNYFVRLQASDDTSGGDLYARMTAVRVNSFDFTQNTYSTTVNTAALAALAAASGNVLANDDAGADGGLSVTEVNGDAVSGSTNIDGLYGTLTIDENGEYTYTPNAEDLPTDSSDSFTYTVVDADGSEDSATLTIDIDNHNYVVDGNDNVAVADAAGGSVNALGGDDVLIGSDQADTLNGGAGDDNLMGNGGDDTLIGGAGNDILTGGAGADIFQWNEGDEGSAASPAVDFITDFSATEGDSLNLSDLLQGEESGDITDYISVAQNGDDVVINVTPDGDGGDMNQVITLQNTTVDQLAGGVDTSGMSQADIINTLINNGQLNVDQS